MRVAIVVSFQNEAAHLPTFLASMIRQDRRPDELLLVDDGSTDGSDRLADEFAARHDFARLIRRPPRPSESDRLAGAHVVKAFHWGVSQLEQPFDVVTKMDADLELSHDHIEAVIGAFEADSSLGIAGGYLALRTERGTLMREAHPPDHVRGPNKFFRRQCFEQIGPLPEHLGWDSIDERRARMMGWRTASIEIPSRDTIHLRPTGAHDGRLRAFRRWGRCAWAYGAPPTYVIAGAVHRMRRRPYVLGGLNYLWGFAHAAARGAERAERETRAFSRQEDRARLRGMLTGASP